ncbi:MAG TPA: hypothetical protein VGQ62_18620 [Chloroflexota bacterium]|jgi:hypothetical protein|nr:hypothetical protein [Chloroflexota bacterium]
MDVLPANVDEPRFAVSDAEPDTHATCTAQSALHTELSPPLELGREEASLLVVDCLVEFLAGLVTRLLH